MGTTRRKAALLRREVEGYRAWLTRRSYTPQTVRNMLTDPGHVGRCLQAEGLDVSDLDEHWMARFRAGQQSAGNYRAMGSRAPVPLLTYLREVGGTPGA